MSGGAWMFIWLMLALKIPIAALFYIVWWATRAPDPAGDAASEDWKRPPVRPDHPRPHRPRPPRRGPHAEPAPRPPARVRALRGRTLRKPSHRA
jgi:hypothetical protein